jgi:ClpP class serine protease
MINQALISEIFNQPWSIEKQYAQGLAMSALGVFRSGLRPASAAKMEVAYALTQSDRSRQDKEIQPGSVGVVTIDGPIVKNSDYSYGIKGTEDAAKELVEMDNNPNIIANILVLNSGGGAVYAIKPLTDAINGLSKPLVIYSKEYLCSAALRIAVHGQYIMVYHPQAIIGSLGTMSSFQNMEPMFEKWGMEFHEIYATLSTLKNKTFNDALEGKYDRMKERMLDPMNEDFIAEVKALRGDKISKKDAGIYAGETYMAVEAAKLGLIDEVGSFDAAIQKAFELAQNNPQNKNNTNMKFEKITALAGKAEPSQEEFEHANAELTEAGITGATLVPESLITEAANVTTERDALVKEKETLTTSLTTATGKVSSLETENAGLKAKLAQGPAAVAPVVESKDPVTEKTADEITADEIAALPHNQALANNPLFN